MNYLAYRNSENFDLEQTSMDNELVEEQYFWKSKWFWFAFIFAIVLICFSISNVGSDIKGMGQVYLNPSLIDNAIEKANSSPEVIEHFGKLAAVEKLAIIEGSATYSDTNKTIAITVRIVGGKSKGKMDIVAHKTSEVWKYKSIAIRDQLKDVTILVAVEN